MIRCTATLGSLLLLAVVVVENHVALSFSLKPTTTTTTTTRTTTRRTNIPLSRWYATTVGTDRAVSSRSTEEDDSESRKQQQQQQQQFQLEEQSEQHQLRRILGSQELLMIPRQYNPSSSSAAATKEHNNNKKVFFPQMIHMNAVVLSETPNVQHLIQAMEDAMNAHPLLRAHVEGDGAPERHLDAMKMVRQGDPNPMTFVATAATAAQTNSQTFTANDILTVIDLPIIVDDNDDKTKLRETLYASWQQSFARDIEDGSLFDIQTGPLWKLEFHRFRDAADNDADNDAGCTSDTKPCALLFGFNHAISDQSSANRLVDQMVRIIAELETSSNSNSSSSSFTPTAQQDMPWALEDSVMGLHQRWNDVKAKGLTGKTFRYAFSKAMEGFKNPVLLPDSMIQWKTNKSGSGFGSADLFGDLKSLISIMTLQPSAGDGDAVIQRRKSALQFRSFPSDLTAKLLKQCHKNKVTISHALTATMALTATDFVGKQTAAEAAGREDTAANSSNNNNNNNRKHSRNYKVLQSLDMRRFGKQIDQGETMACMAGSMDLMYGPLPDNSGEAIRTTKNKAKEEEGSSPVVTNLDLFWQLAAEARQQTKDFVAADGPVQAVRVFDLGMTISDMNNLIYFAAQSEDTEGRAYSAGVTNAGVYERQTSYQQQQQSNKGNNSDSESEPRAFLNVQHGRFKVQDVYFASSHAYSGSLYQLSSLTVDGAMKLTFHPVSPIVPEETSKEFADAFVELLQVVANST